jgi:nitrogen fixation protein FixH
MKPGTFWAMLPVMLLGSSVFLYMVIVPFMTNDPSHALVPDYEERAANWDLVTAQRRMNRELGWQLRVRAPYGASDGTMRLVIEVMDRDGVAIHAETVSGVALHVARAANRHTFTADRIGPGRFETIISSDRPGIWEVDLKARRGDEIFAERRRVSVAEMLR